MNQSMQSPFYLIDLDVLDSTLTRAENQAKSLGVTLAMALKGFPLPAAFPTIAPHIAAVTASGLYEAKLAQGLGRPVHVHAPAYREDEMDELCSLCSHIVFNTSAQLRRFGPSARSRGVSVGLRVNPCFSVSESSKYDPCRTDSRYGMLVSELTDEDLALVDGLHLHALCAADADGFAALVERATSVFGDRLKGLSWMNLGGGMMIGQDGFATPRAVAALQALKEKGDFEVLIEPCESLTTESGTLTATVLDVIRRDIDVAILDVSGACHMPDVINMPYVPRIIEPATAEDGWPTVLGGNTCLSADVLGTFRFAKRLSPGDRVVFAEMGAYTFCQANWFNGVRRPSVFVTSKKDGPRLVRSWNEGDFARSFGGSGK